jgi:hypothetical protein
VVAPRDQGALLHVGQKGVLLTLIEAVHLVDKEDGAAAFLLANLTRRGHGLADVLDTREDGGKFLEMSSRVGGQETRQGSLPRARRSPEDH